jgi:hypothetical protein
MSDQFGLDPSSLDEVLKKVREQQEMLEALQKKLDQLVKLLEQRPKETSERR